MELNLKEFVLFAILIYVGFMVSDWIATALGLATFGIVGTLAIYILPIAIIYYVWKKWLHKAAN